MRRIMTNVWMGIVWIECLLVVLFLPTTGFCRDYVVELFEEHYQEELMVGDGKMKIYHSWQVKSIYGNKLLVIVGDDPGYRKWLRKSTAKHKLYLVKIPPAGDERFKYDRAVLLNVQQIHAVWGRKWKCKKCRSGPPPIEPEPGSPSVTLPESPEIIRE